MKIKVTKYNEVAPAELDKLFAAGAKLIKSEYAVGVYIGTYYQYKYSHREDKEKVKVYSDDNIIINNITLPLSIGGTYDRTIEINVIEEMDKKEGIFEENAYQVLKLSGDEYTPI